MDSASEGLTGLVLDSSAVITAERKKQPVTEFIERSWPLMVRWTGGSVAVTGYRGLACAWDLPRSPEASQRRREYIEELVSLILVHPATNKTAWLVGQIEG